MSLLEIVALGSLLLAGDPADSSVVSNSARSFDQERSKPSLLVQEALLAEQRGDFKARQSLLEAAMEQDGNLDSARWHLGQVRFEDTWLTPEAVSAQTEQDSRHRKYRDKRNQTADRANDHYNLARWCQSQKLSPQRRAHLLAAAHLEPGNPLWQKALGRSRHEGFWLSDVELAEAKRRRDEAIVAYHEWKPQLHRLRKELVDQSSTESFESTASSTYGIDHRAIPAIEEILSVHSEKTALWSVDLLSGMSHGDATPSLVRHAVWSEWPTVRQQAIRALQSRNPEHFVPSLIEYLRPARAGEAWVRLGDGRPAGIWFVQDFDTNHVQISVAAGTVRPRGGVAAAESRDDEARRVFNQIHQENQFRTSNALLALRAVSGVDLGAEQKAWREWWSEINGVYYDSYSDEPERQTRRRIRDIGATSMPLGGISSCFSAGTPVWTQRGLVAIDQIKRGDLVLSTDPDTGQLAYRTVVNRTIRPRTKITNLTVNGETLGATLAHLVWVSGKGWVKVKDLESGEPIRGCGEIHTLDAVTEGEPAMAYNLVVDDFHTYFVGQSRILVHDITPITDSLLRVPGLKLNLDSENQTTSAAE